jgi:hypothetical protein
MKEIENDGFESDGVEGRRIIGEADNPGDDEDGGQDEF